METTEYHDINIPDGDSPQMIHQAFIELNANLIRISERLNRIDDYNVGIYNDKVKLTSEGGLVIRLINATGADSIKGYCVTTSDAKTEAVKLVPVNVPNPIGVFYEAGIKDGALAWIVVAGIADVYFWTATTRGHLARTGLTADTGEIAGQAMSEAQPTSPFNVDKHFCEIGHVLETRASPGLAKCVLHQN